jgi:hypothetical protein
LGRHAIRKDNPIAHQTTKSEHENQQTSGQDAQKMDILSLSTADLAGLSTDELTGNKTAVTMVMHYYKQLVDENISLKNNFNTLRTYVNGYAEKKTNARMGAILLFVSNIGGGSYYR